MALNGQQSYLDVLPLQNIASHIIKVHTSADVTATDTRTSKEYNWLKRYIQYCRTECHPRLSDSAATMLQESYVRIRQPEVPSLKDGAYSFILGSHVANDSHVLEAIRLFNNATMDAARSGINQHINLTPEMAKR
ncbi:hypothetical protein F0562_003201 [Nyssa sinensis]|uniref:DNA helicase n=1 Tax=Nyssa sinensis TaxID=561372 RepID=A0A5J5BYR6_9ASTE|nr:hypothetical protein F0562_003201 [Nyssa sinensis]